MDSLGEWNHALAKSFPPSSHVKFLRVSCERGSTLLVAARHCFYTTLCHLIIYDSLRATFGPSPMWIFGDQPFRNWNRRQRLISSFFANWLHLCSHPFHILASARFLGFPKTPVAGELWSRVVLRVGRYMT